MGWTAAGQGRQEDGGRILRGVEQPAAGSSAGGTVHQAPTTGRQRTAAVHASRLGLAALGCGHPPSSGVKTRWLRGEMIVTSYLDVSMSRARRAPPHPVPRITSLCLHGASVRVPCGGSVAALAALGRRAGGEWRQEQQRRWR